MFDAGNANHVQVCKQFVLSVNNLRNQMVSTSRCKGPEAAGCVGHVHWRCNICRDWSPQISQH